MKAVYKYEGSSLYYYWNTASETGYVTLKSKKIYASNENTLNVRSVENNSLIIVLAMIFKTKTTYTSYIYLKAKRS